MIPTQPDARRVEPPPGAAPHHSVTEMARVLADWRAAERELDATSADDPGWAAATARAADARQHYHELVEDREHGRLTELSPLTLQHG